jgi:8-hydroxy-5-deazaflavin:NADPH oxidoreductase
MRIGIIGAGHIGATLAKLFVDAGHEATVSNSRGPEMPAGLVEGLGGGVRAMTAAEAERFGDVVVVSVPLGRYCELPSDAVFPAAALGLPKGARASPISRRERKPRRLANSRPRE